MSAEVKAVGFKRHLPNIASFIRIFGTFSLPFLMWDSWEVTIGNFEKVPIVWIIVYLFLVFTDKVDGTLARKLHAESELGAKLDALGDTLILVMGATCTFAKFVYEKLSQEEILGISLFWVYIGLMVITVINKVLVLLLTQKYHGEGNMLHSLPQKTFAVGTYFGVAYWAFMRTIPMWSLLFLFALNIYATIDEIIYIVRSDNYNMDFKGHGFEKYPLRKK
jgi:CDP-diacylglycerol--glycerol-3-phosphate 3-phosphatidyltransferase